MDRKVSLFLRYMRWSNERFPIIGALLIAGFLFYVPYCFGGLLGNQSQPSYIAGIPGMFVIFLVLLHMRIFDEHKDFDKDVVAYPERILSQGILTLKHLRYLLYIVLAIEIGISFSIGWIQLFIWIGIMVWSLLMFYEFFVPEFLNRHMGLYLISHQLSILLVAGYGLSMGYDITTADRTAMASMFVLLIGIMCATITYEIARKTWPPEKEQEHADSYTKVWGIWTAVVVNQAFAVLATLAFAYLYATYSIGLTFTIVLAAFNLFFLVTGLLFASGPNAKREKLVMAGGILFMFGAFVNSMVAFIGGS